MDSTSWIRYSDYEIVKDERNMDCIRPAANSVPVCYDVAAKLGRNVAELMNIVLDDQGRDGPKHEIRAPLWAFGPRT